MLKIAVIIALLLLAFLAVKYLDESQQKTIIKLLLVVLGGVTLFFLGSELFR